jgi:peptidoglycan/xylan/chitin deacetylase (PgdA/CDA1 family)
MEVTTDTFQRQIAWIRANREIVGLETAMDRWGESGSERLTVLTFDDGYRDFYVNAFPTLRDHGIPFTLYLATQSIESGVSLGPAEGAEPISWGQLESIMDGGRVTIGAHTHSHRDLRSATTAEIADELGSSDEIISRRLGVEPRHFAYPWAYWSPTADPEVRGRYQSAVVGFNPRPTDDVDHWQLSRYPVQLSDEFWFFKRRLARGLRLEEAVRRRLRGYSGP